MLELLEQLSEHGRIRKLDYQFARFIHSIETHNADEVAGIAGVLSFGLSQGHICINLSDLKSATRFEAIESLGESVRNLMLDIDWDSILKNADCVGNGYEKQHTPLIYDGNRLYLHKYWYYEQFLARELRHKSQPLCFSASELSHLASSLEKLFPVEEREGEKVNWQKVAVATALSRKLSVISGGPGTGKTTTVVKLLSALVEQGRLVGEIPTIQLTAPTGKASARLTESIGGAIESLNLDSESKSHIPTQASTIHRLLGVRANRAEFLHNEHNRLHLDILVVDEASMVDLPLMAKLLAALPERARLILLGDKDQLSSVEAGAVLGDICSFLAYGYSKEQARLLVQLAGGHESDYTNSSFQGVVNPLADSLCLLRKSFRFDEHSGIGKLARAINSNDQVSIKDTLEGRYHDVHFQKLTPDSYRLMIEFVAAQYRLYLECVIQATGKPIDSINKEAVKALSLFSQCRLLSAVREGKYGHLGLNEEIEKVLKTQRLISPSDDHWYVGRPVMITRNDHALGLFNGDIGIALLVTDTDEAENKASYIKVFFQLPDGKVKSVLPSRLPAHETAYAMTIHKSQGSEFATTVVVLPDRDSPLISRELIYTGVTRAKNRLYLYADEAVLIKGVETKTERFSGLKEALSNRLVDFSTNHSK